MCLAAVNLGPDNEEGRLVASKSYLPLLCPSEIPSCTHTGRCTFTTARPVTLKVGSTVPVARWQIYGVPDLLDLESRSLRSQNSGILGSLDSAIWAMVRKVNPIFCSPDKRRRSLKKNAKRAHSHWIVTTRLLLIQGVFSLALPLKIPSTKKLI